MILALFSALSLAQGDGLSPFQAAKAEWFLENRLPCLGCHELDGDGGRVAPSLSALKGIRTREYVASMIADPQGVVPGTIMPKIPLPRTTVDLIATYLVQREPTSPPPVSPATPKASPPTDTGPASLYARSCAPCHGDRGRGDGFNARFLPVKPTAHADAGYMSRRTDDALFDAVSAGGYVMNRSPRMPAFGQTLTREQIRGLVRYMRTLCKCEGPAWSRDNP